MQILFINPLQICPKKEHRKRVYKKIKMEKETDVRTTVNNLKNSYALTYIVEQFLSKPSRHEETHHIRIMNAKRQKAFVKGRVNEEVRGMNSMVVGDRGGEDLKKMFKGGGVIGFRSEIKYL